MITQEEFVTFRKFYTYLKPLVLEKLKEKYEIEYGKPFPKDEDITNIEYSIEDNCFSIETEWHGRYSCNDKEYYSLLPRYLYDKNAMLDFRNEIEKKKKEAELKEKEEKTLELMKKLNQETKLLRELAEKYDMELKPKEFNSK